MSVLLIAEHNNKELKAFTLNAVTAASQIDTDVHALVIGNNCADVAKAASQLPLSESSDLLKFKTKNGNGPKSNNSNKYRRNNKRKRY